MGVEMSVVQGLFLSREDREILEKQYEFQGCEEALKHVVMHIDRIEKAENKDAQRGIALGAIWAYERAGLFSVGDMKWLLGEVEKK